MFRGVMLALAFTGCNGSVISVGDAGEDTGAEGDTNVADTATDDTGDTASAIDTSVDPSLAEERAPTSQIVGLPEGLAGMALDEGDIDGDGRDDLLVGAPGVNRYAPDAVTANPGPGVVYLVSGPIREDVQAANAAVHFSGVDDWDGFGSSLTHGDFDNDGTFDVAIGGGVATSAAPNASGFVSVQYGPFTASSSSLPTVLTRGLGGDGFGTATAVGDLDHDGIDDIVVGAPMGGEAEQGEVDLYRGVAITGLENSPFVRISGAASDARLGGALATSDVDGDGAEDLLIGDAGAAYLFLGPVNGDRATSEADATFVGVSEGDGAGTSLSFGDMNNDGYQDALIGAPRSDQSGMDAGAAYLVHGPLQGEMPLSAASAVLAGGQIGSEAGTRVAYANDMNSDGQPDLIVGAPGYSDEEASDAGRGYLVLGPIEGWSPLAEAVYVPGPQRGGWLGQTVLADTELTGDSLPDILFAAPMSDPIGDRPGIVLLVGGL